MEENEKMIKIEIIKKNYFYYMSALKNYCKRAFVFLKCQVICPVIYLSVRKSFFIV